MLVPIVLCAASLALGQSTWTKYDGNPVLMWGEPGEWDDNLLFAPSILHDGSGFHMWYSGCPVGQDLLDSCGIGYATSPDGMVWTKHPSNPVLTVGAEESWEDNSVYSPSVIFDGETYTMWYLGEQAFYATPDPIEVGIGMATSTDGISWTKLPGNPVLTEGDDGAWDEEISPSLSVLSDGETYRMWYGVFDETPNVAIGYATSPDGITWTKQPDNPVLEAGPAGAWDGSTIESLEVFSDGATFHGLYTGWREGAQGYSIGYASSPDGVAWTKGAGHGGPVLKGGRLGSDWDFLTVGWHGVVVHDAQAWMYFFGNSGALGLATASMDNLFDPPDCLNDNRFRVGVWWWDAEGNVGDGVPVKLTDDSGYLWFFDQDNVEMVVKVLDACAVNGHYWVFAAGLTNVGATITVTDTQTMEQVTYMNTLGEAFQPIQDTAAFAVCD